MVCCEKGAVQEARQGKYRFSRSQREGASESVSCDGFWTASYLAFELLFGNDPDGIAEGMVRSLRRVGL